MKDKTMPEEKKKNVTTIEFSDADDAAILAIQAHMLAENPAQKAPKRAVVSFALQKTLETLQK